MRILASLVKGLNIRLADIFIRVGVGLKELISVILIVEVGGSIADLLTIWRRFLLNSANIVGADMFINYIAGTAD